MTEQGIAWQMKHVIAFAYSLQCGGNAGDLCYRQKWQCNVIHKHTVPLFTGGGRAVITNDWCISFNSQELITILFDLLLYFLGKQLRHNGTVSYPSHTVPGQASRRQITST